MFDLDDVVDAEVMAGKGANPSNVQETNYFDSVDTIRSEFQKVNDSASGV